MNVTYLIGAGASAQAIPTVRDFNTRFILFIDLLKDSDPTINDKVREFYQAVKEDVPTHYSVDTYARKLLFQNDEKYIAFKTLLSFYFLFEQMKESENLLKLIPVTDKEAILKQISIKKDPRYDAFFAALIKKETERLPVNLSIISWNYDLQFELSFAEFLGIPIELAFRRLATYPCPSSEVSSYVEKASFLKLNGIAGIYYDHKSKGGRDSSYKLWIDPKENKFDNTAISYCNTEINLNLSISQKVHESLLTFAWDKGNEVDQARKRAKKIIEETNSLIIIGYSFPNYNRTTDKEIFSSITPAKLKNIYLQVSNQDYDLCKSGFEASLPQNSWNLQITPIPYLSLFYIDNSLL